jgi:hypothetical protein
LLIALLRGYNLVALPPAKIIPFILKKTFAGAKVQQFFHMNKFLRQKIHKIATINVENIKMGI